MLTKVQADEAKQRTATILNTAGILLTPAESEKIEIADFGLSDLSRQGLQLITYINTERVCAKDLVLFAGQTCPEHRHPPVGDDPGKEETFRCRQGLVYVYLEGEPTPHIGAMVPEGSEPYYTVFHEYILKPGEQVTIPPNTLHWFQAGDEGCIVSEFSTRSRDEFDFFTDPNVVRASEIE